MVFVAVAERAWPQAEQPQLAMPDAEKIVLLVRTTLITLNDALQTGNFTVLRDIAAPGFREVNTAGRLAQSFSDLARISSTETNMPGSNRSSPLGSVAWTRTFRVARSTSGLTAVTLPSNCCFG